MDDAPGATPVPTARGGGGRTSLDARRRDPGVRSGLIDRRPLASPYCGALTAALPAAFAPFTVLASDDRFTLYDLAERAGP